MLVRSISWWVGLVSLADAALAEQPVDIELVLAVDVSGSVNAGEQELQRTGLTRAFRDPSVIGVIRTLSPGLAVVVMGFAGAAQCRTVVDWQMLTDRSSAEGFAGAVDKAFPVAFDFAHKTAIGDAVGWSLDEFASNPYPGRAKVDISGGGQNSDGAHPALRAIAPSQRA